MKPGRNRAGVAALVLLMTGLFTAAGFAHDAANAGHRATPFNPHRLWWDGVTMWMPTCPSNPW